MLRTSRTQPSFCRSCFCSLRFRFRFARLLCLLASAFCAAVWGGSAACCSNQVREPGTGAAAGDAAAAAVAAPYTSGSCSFFKERNIRKMKESFSAWMVKPNTLIQIRNTR